MTTTEFDHVAFLRQEASLAEHRGFPGIAEGFERCANEMEGLVIIDILRGLGEGWSVEIIHDNPDPETKDQQCGVIVWSDYRTTEHLFLGETVVAALRAALEKTIQAISEVRK